MDGATAQAIEISIANEAVTQVGFKRLSPDAVIPTKAHPTDSGFDLVASVDVIIEPGETVVVPTGIAVQLPAGYEATVRPRSGVTSKTKLRVQLGTIDNGYAGEIGIIVDNTAVNTVARGNVGVDLSYPLLHTDGTESRISTFNNNVIYQIRKGDRIGQLVITHLPDVEAVEVFDVEESARGDKGFGSTGVVTTSESVCDACDGSGRFGYGVCDECGGMGWKEDAE